MYYKITTIQSAAYGHMFRPITVASFKATGINVLGNLYTYAP